MSTPWLITITVPRAGATAPRRVGGGVAHADDHRGAPSRLDDGAAEEQHLGALVPLGMVEEREVVHGHDGGDAEPCRHRVVRAVPDVGAEPVRRGWGRGPAPRRGAPDAPRARPPRPAPLGAMARRARSVAASRDEHELEVVAARELAGDLGGVHARSGDLVGHGRHVEQDPHAVTVVCAASAGRRERRTAAARRRRVASAATRRSSCASSRPQPGVDVTAFTARHPRAAVDARAARTTDLDGVDPVVLPLPRPVLYDAWHVLGRRRSGATGRAGRPRPRAVAGGAARTRACRSSSPCTTPRRS